MAEESRPWPTRQIAGYSAAGKISSDRVTRHVRLTNHRIGFDRIGAHLGGPGR